MKTKANPVRILGPVLTSQPLAAADHGTRWWWGAVTVNLIREQYVHRTASRCKQRLQRKQLPISAFRFTNCVQVLGMRGQI
jgi:hypothetical protein